MYEKDKFYKDDIKSDYFPFNKKIILMEREVWTILPNSDIFFYSILTENWTVESLPYQFTVNDRSF